MTCEELLEKCRTWFTIVMLLFSMFIMMALTVMLVWMAIDPQRFQTHRQDAKIEEIVECK